MMVAWPAQLVASQRLQSRSIADRQTSLIVLCARAASKIDSVAAAVDIMVVRCAVVLCFHLSLLNPAWGMEPLALLATQPVWQAAQPITVNVDYDGKLQFCALRFAGANLCSCSCSVPAFGTIDEVLELQQASKVEYKVAKR